MKKTLVQLLNNPDYKMFTVTQYGYFSSKFGSLAVPYKGVYGTGYRVYIINENDRKDGKKKATIYYFIERKESV